MVGGARLQRPLISRGETHPGGVADGDGDGEAERMLLLQGEVVWEQAVKDMRGRLRIHAAGHTVAAVAPCAWRTPAGAVFR